MPRASPRQLDGGDPHDRRGGLLVSSLGLVDQRPPDGRARTRLRRRVFCESGSDRDVYAESILKTCKLCVESPLACVSGVTGADLKKRIVRIMAEIMPNKLSLGGKVLLGAFGVAAIVVPVFFGLMNAPQIRAQAPPTTNAPLPSFEVASIKPDPSPSGLTTVSGDTA